MELKTYLRILLKKWWMVLSTFLITFTSTVVFTFTQVPTYMSSATFVVKPNTAFVDVKSFVSGLDILSRRTEIAATYAEVASSHAIKQEAIKELNLSRDQRRGLSVASLLVAGTNVIEITVEGNDPIVVRDFAGMVGAKTLVYVRELYEPYDLRPLDEAVVPSSPIKPNKTLNLGLGAALGLALGAGLALLSEYLQAPLESAAKFGIFDVETGVYNKRYFRQRLGEEMSRAKRNRYLLSLALMNVDKLGAMDSSFSPQARGEVLRKVAMFLKRHLREEDIVARLDQTVFAFLLPDMPVEEAKEMMEQLQTKMAWTSFELERSNVKLNLNSATGVAAYRYNGTRQDEFLAEVTGALKQAEADGYTEACALLDDQELR